MVSPRFPQRSSAHGQGWSWVTQRDFLEAQLGAHGGQNITLSHPRSAPLYSHLFPPS